MNSKTIINYFNIGCNLFIFKIFILSIKNNQLLDKETGRKKIKILNFIIPLNLKEC